jgi:hypothetical protein
LSGLALTAVAIIGAIVSKHATTGTSAPYGIICFVGSITYALSLLVLNGEVRVLGPK